MQCDNQRYFSERNGVKMANLRLKKLILEVVDNQLRDNDPSMVREVYDRLTAEGYSVRETKEKIGAVVLEEIYDDMKENQPHDEKRYVDALKNMMRQCLDFEDSQKILTEWDEWDRLVQEGYEAQENQNDNEMITFWWKAWELFQKIIETAEYKISVSGIMESQDYQYPVDAWLQDLEMELGNTGEHEKRMEFCQRILEMLDWNFDDDSCFKNAIGEELYAAGKSAEGRAWFENWLKKEPHNQNALNVFSWCVQEQEGIKEAYQIIRREVIGIACTMSNELVFERARRLAQQLELKEDLKWIESQLTAFQESLEKADLYNDLYDEFKMPVQQPVVKEKKIYPNDPCPCGSGKKYKKCCGRK